MQSIQIFLKSIVALVRRTSKWERFLVLFFSLSFVLLFFGDGFASYVDAAGAAATVIVVWVASAYLRKEREMSAQLFAPFLVLMIVLGVGIIHSIDPGSSLRVFARYIDAFLLFYVFYTRSTPARHQLFLVGACLFAVGAGLVSLIGSSLVAWRGLLPDMNLLFLSAGHNHVTDILLFSLIPFLLCITRFPKGIKYGALALYLGMFVFSQARAALTIAVLVTTLFTVPGISIKVFGERGKVGLVAFVAAVFFLGVFLPEIRPRVVTNQNKTPLIDDRRIEYWKQAWRAIAEKPSTGHGPGTFYLLSERHESAPSNSSWFAHNVILEVWAETGAIGVIVLAWVFWSTYMSSLYRVRRAFLGGERVIAAAAPIPILVYSLFDFSLSYLVVWFLVWACFGSVSAYAHT